MKFSAMSYFIGKNKIFGSNFQIFKEKIARFLFEYGPNNMVIAYEVYEICCKNKKIVNHFLYTCCIT